MMFDTFARAVPEETSMAATLHMATTFAAAAAARVRISFITLSAHILSSVVE
jgi:hypothetical protein